MVHSGKRKDKEISKNIKKEYGSSNEFIEVTYIFII